MDVVFGDGALARAIATALSEQGSAVLASPHVSEGPYLSRWADLSSGEGVGAAIKHAQRAFVVMGPRTEVSGVFAVLKPGAVSRGVVVLPIGTDLPRGFKKFGDWSVLRVGPVWGPDVPLVSAWAQTIAAGGRVWLTEGGTFLPVSTQDVVLAAREAAARRAMRWVLVGTERCGLPRLAAAIADGLGVPLRAWNMPSALVARRAGVDTEDWTLWAQASKGKSRTEGWERPPLAGPAGWLGDPTRWQVVERRR